MTTLSSSSSNSSAMNAQSNEIMLQCYNKGCGKQFLARENTPESCLHHPGVPVFHDALKGWSCCNKKSTDFSTFLSMPGCAKSYHSNEKPVEPEKPAPETIIQTAAKISESLETRKAPEQTPRPTTDEPLVEMKRTIAPSLKAALEKLTESLQNQPTESENNESIPVGTPCKNATCQARYQDESSNNEKCTYHSGAAIFHEGMKYWSCCQRKTSDFDNFLNQAGCTEGSHVWIKKTTSESEKTSCRYDFHQHGGFVVLTVYSKMPVPEKTFIQANQIKLNINIAFEGGQKLFQKEIELYGVSKFDESVVNFFQAKVEIKIKKADPISWPKLEFN